jgi:ParB/RepB/Spo0J family partition protein
MSDTAQTELIHAPIDEIKENPVALRSVNRKSQEFQSLKQSISQVGVTNAISLQRKKDEETGEEYYELCDGLQRFTAAKELGLPTIPAQIVSLDQATVLKAQIISNAQRVKTKPMEYTRQLQRLLAYDPLLTEAELASQLGATTKWISDRLGLTKIANPEIAKLVNDGDIVLSNAYALAKLPSEEQPNFVQDACTQKPKEFVPTAEARAKEIKEANKKGKDAEPPKFTPQPHLQKLSAIKDELDNGRQGQASIERLRETGAITDDQVPAAALGFAEGIKWVSQMDDVSIEAARAKWEQKRQEKAEAKAKRDREKARKKAAADEEKAKKSAKAAAAADEAASKLGLVDPVRSE